MINKSWENLIEKIYGLEKLEELLDKCNNLRLNSTIYPDQNKLLRVFDGSSPDEIKVIILGQDPYHGHGQANGLAFSVNSDKALPASLKNIFKELNNDLGLIKIDGNLESWSKQGVLLLNSILSVEATKPLSHKNLGWQEFTDSIIEYFGSQENRVFILMGKYSQDKIKFINEKNNLVIKTSHPSPLSAYRGFFGSNIFSRTNDYLNMKNIACIDWGE